MRDLSIFNKFNFEIPPVGVKKLDKDLAFCEMLGEAQKSPTCSGHIKGKQQQGVS